MVHGDSSIRSSPLLLLLSVLVLLSLLFSVIIPAESFAFTSIATTPPIFSSGNGSTASRYQRNHHQQQQQRQQQYRRSMVIDPTTTSESVLDDQTVERSTNTTTTTTIRPPMNTAAVTTTTSTTNIQYIGTMSDTIQQMTFIMAFVLLGIGTNLCIELWYTIGRSVVGTDYFTTIQTQLFPLLFGSIFSIVGICHFVFVTNFARIVPPNHCWGGIWNAPTPFRRDMIQLLQRDISYAEYHSYWTGIVEFIGGVWLFYTGLVPTVSSTVPATLLFLLTVGVTPANLYMFTHNATPGGSIPSLQYPFGHIARFIVQCGLLSNFYIMMQ